MKKFLKILGTILVVIIVGPIAIGLTIKAFKSAPPPAGELFDVGGYNLHINCMAPKKASGNELPTVIVETGSGVISSMYYWLQQSVSETTKVCLYDRSGLGRSDESSLPRDSATVATALNVLLDKAKIKRPFVFAGHSIAGLYMRDYVERYPGEVAGIAFLDASHPNQTEALGMNIADQLQGMEQQLSVVKLLSNLGLLEFLGLFNSETGLEEYPLDVQKQIEVSLARTEHLDASYAEMRDFEKAAEQASRNLSLADMPIVVITAGEEIPAAALPAGVDPNAWFETWITLQKDITALSNNGRHVVMETANHGSLISDKENAEKAAAYIKDLVQEIANR